MVLATLLAASLTTLPGASMDTLRLPAILSDNMVLQRGVPVPIWGWAAPGKRIEVRFGKRSASAVAGPDGAWRVRLAPLATDKGGVLEVTDGVRRITVRNVLVGDVWLCSGQSNMEWPVSLANDPEKVIPKANHPGMRLFQVSNFANSFHTGDVQGRWVVCTPETVAGFSAVGYFMGRELHRTSGVPIGLIDSTWGGTPAEAWTSLAELRRHAETAPIAQRFADSLPELERRRAEWAAKQAGRENGLLVDPGNKGFGEGWAAADLNDADWKTMRVPAAWESLGAEMDIDGAVWFRRELDIPASAAGKDLELRLGAVDDFDVTYFNGEEVGRTGKETPNWWSANRRYNVPGRLVRAGTNVIAVRVFDHTGGGGLTGGEPMEARLSTGAIPLAGSWRYKVEYSQPTPPPMPEGADSPNAPQALYAGMIRPLAPFAIRGAAWYQGESNAWRAEQYRTLLAAMIADWRRLWGQGDFPFLIVELAGFMPPSETPVESEWAELRESQQWVARKVYNVALASAVDVGQIDDIHPRDKRTVGLRLAYAARALTGDRSGPARIGPIYRDARWEQNETLIHLRFWRFRPLKTSDGGPVRGVAVCGADRKWVWAEARIEGDELMVWSPLVPKPVAVRYGWHSWPGGNLIDFEGLPVSPFRTDRFPGVTAGRR